MTNAVERDTDIAGLTTSEAGARLKRFGPNEPANVRAHSVLADVWHVFANPLVLILVIAALASAVIGDTIDAAIIGTIVLLSALIDLSQTRRSHQAIDQLRQRVAPTATVLRDGTWSDVK